MKNKKFLCLVLALVMVLGAFGPVFAETAATDKKEDKKEEVVKVEKVTGKDAKVQWLRDHKIVVGRKVNENEKDNDLALDKNIKRSEITKLLVYAVGKADLAEKVQGVKIYTDVPATHWANGVINVGSNRDSKISKFPMIIGYPDNSFKPDRPVTYAELAKMLVTLVKKDLTQAKYDDALAHGWPNQWILWATELGIFEDVTYDDADKPAIRENAFVMLYNALYKLGELRKVPANETMGIISDYSKGKLVLNQGDYKKEFTVNADTNFVKGTGKNEDTQLDKVITWNDGDIAGGYEYYLGSLVRVIANDKGEVSHIIQLGNPKDLEGINNGWRAVADGTISTKADPTSNHPDGTATVLNDKIVFKGGRITVDKNGNNNVYDNYDRDKHVGEIKFAGLTENNEPVNKEVNFTKETRFFVADADNGQLTEVKDIAAVKALLDENVVGKVYAGFDVLPETQILEATVVVFNKVDKGANSEVVRVLEPIDTNFHLTVNKPNMVKANAEVVKYNLRDDKVEFPFNKNWEQYDVLEVSKNLQGVVSAVKLIDEGVDPIYKITKVYNKALDSFEYVPGRRIDTIELTDDKGKVTVDVRVDTDYFFGDEVKPGAFVQVRFLTGKIGTDQDDKDIIGAIPAVDIISVRDDRDAVRGELPVELNAKDLREVSGVISNIEAGDAKGYSVFTIKEGNSQYPTRYVATTKALENYLAGDKVTFLADIATKYAEYNAPLAFQFVNESLNERLANVAPVEAAIDALPDPANDVTTDEGAKAIEDAKTAYDALTDEEKALVPTAKVNKLNDAVAKAKAYRDAQDVATVKDATEPAKTDDFTYATADGKKVSDLKDTVKAQYANELGVVVGDPVLTSPTANDGDALSTQAYAFTVDLTKGDTTEAVTRTINVTVN